MISNITSFEYWQEVDAIAEKLAEDFGEESLIADIRKMLRRHIAHHHWMTETKLQLQVLDISPNGDYWANSFGLETVLRSDGSISWNVMAFGAMYADIDFTYWKLREQARVAARH